MNQSQWKKAVFLTLEYLGLFAGVFAFLVFFRPSQFLARAIGTKAPAAPLLHSFLSALRWTIICLVTVVFALAFRKIKAGWNLKDLGFKIQKSWAKDIWIGVLVFSLANVIFLPQTIAVFPSKAKLAGIGFLNEWTQMSSPFYIFGLFFLLSILGTFIGSLWEEIYWRGYVQTLVSRAFAPSSGFFASMLFFSLGHYFTRPEWGWLDVLGAVIGGISFCLVFYATGSLLACAVSHALSNAWWDYPFALYLIKGSTQSAYVFILILWAVTLVLCIMGRKEVFSFLKKSKELFSSSGWKMSFIGIIFGIVALVFEWGQSLLRKTCRETFLGFLVVFSVVAVGLSFLFREKGKTI